MVDQPLRRGMPNGKSNHTADPSTVWLKRSTVWRESGRVRLGFPTWRSARSARRFFLVNLPLRPSIGRYVSSTVFGKSLRLSGGRGRMRGKQSAGLFVRTHNRNAMYRQITSAQDPPTNP